MLFESHSRVPTTPAYTPDNGMYNPDAFNRNKLLVGAASYARPIGGVTSTSTLTLSRHELDPQSGYLNVYSNMKKSYKYAYGSLVKLEEQLSWKPARALTVTTGGTVERFIAIPQGADLNEPVRSRHQPGTILDTNITDEFVKLRYTNTGVFGQAQYSASPRVALTLGARADYNTRYGATFNPRVGVVTQPANGTTLKVLYGSAYLAPSPYQSYGHYGSFYSIDGGVCRGAAHRAIGGKPCGPRIRCSVGAGAPGGPPARLYDRPRHDDVAHSISPGKIAEPVRSTAIRSRLPRWDAKCAGKAVPGGTRLCYGGTPSQ